MWGGGFETVIAVGRHRGGSQLIELLMPTRYLTSFRSKLVHRPGVLRKLRESSRYEERTREDCDALAASLNKGFPPTENLGERKALFQRALDLMRDGRGKVLRDLVIAALDRADAGAEDAMTVFVLLDFLEQSGASLAYDELVSTLRRQRDNATT